MTQFIVQGYPAFAYTGGRDFDPQRPAVVFVHGAAFDHSVWQWQSRALAHRGFTVLAVDLPRHGRSPGTLRHTIGGLADWVAGLLDAAMIERAARVGHSMGSLVALETAIRVPHRISRLALLGTALPMPVGDAFLAAAADAAPESLDMEAVWGHARNVALAGSPVPGTSLLGASRALNGRAHAGVLHADLRACAAFTAPAASVAALPMPVLVLAGRGDQMTPPKAGRAVADLVPGATFASLDAGHAMMVEAPREVLGALEAFLR